jgi:hypothetical protein
MNEFFMFSVVLFFFFSMVLLFVGVLWIFAHVFGMKKVKSFASSSILSVGGLWAVSMLMMLTTGKG